MPRAAVAGLAALVCVVLAAFGGEGGGVSDSRRALPQTAAKLGDIRSGDLSLRLVVDPREEGGEFGFELSGPFQLAEEGKLPVAEIEYTQLADDERETVTVTSTGDEAFVTVDGTAYELPPEQADRLRSAGSSLGGGNDGDGGGEGLGELRLNDWIRNAESSGGDEIGGDATDKVEADLDVVAAVNDLLELAAGVTGEAPEIEGDEAELLRDSVRDARIEVHTGKDDRLLRLLRIEAEFDPELPEALDELAQAAGSTVEFELRIESPNDPVEVEAPANPRPFSELGS
jgi:hypothetical protein